MLTPDVGDVGDAVEVAAGVVAVPAGGVGVVTGGAVAVPLAVVVGDAVDELPGEADAEGAAVPLAPGDGERLGLAEGEGERLGLADGEGERLAEGEGLPRGATGVTSSSSLPPSPGPYCGGGSYCGMGGRASSVSAVVTPLWGPATSIQMGPRLKAISRPALS